MSFPPKLDFTSASRFPLLQLLTILDKMIVATRNRRLPFFFLLLLGELCAPLLVFSCNWAALHQDPTWHLDSELGIYAKAVSYFYVN